MTSIGTWDIFELELQGPSTGNPFADVDLSAEFKHGARTLRVPGFYDGDGIYRVRFMPDEAGDWRFVTLSSVAELDGKTGAFAATPPAASHHGPVRVRGTYHFAHADGTAYFPFGTTCYAWTHQPLDMQAATLRTLAKTRFN